MRKRQSHIFVIMIAILTVALITACDRPEPNENEIPDFTIHSLAGTSWSGTYTDVLNHNGQHQMLFRWTVDFNDEGKGMVVMEVTSPVIEEIIDEFEMTYTYDGAKQGTINYSGYDYDYSSDFTVDPMNRSMDMELLMHFFLSEDAEEPVQFGGKTTLYLVGR